MYPVWVCGHVHTCMCTHIGVREYLQALILRQLLSFVCHKDLSLAWDVVIYVRLADWQASKDWPVSVFHLSITGVARVYYQA